MKIKVLGSGCPNCIRLEKLVKKVIENLKSEATIEKVTDINDIMDYGVMMTPALVIEEKVVSMGKIPSEEEIEKYLTR